MMDGSCCVVGRVWVDHQRYLRMLFFRLPSDSSRQQFRRCHSDLRIIIVNKTFSSVACLLWENKPKRAQGCEPTSVCARAKTNFEVYFVLIGIRRYPLKHGERMPYGVTQTAGRNTRPEGRSHRTRGVPWAISRIKFSTMRALRRSKGDRKYRPAGVAPPERF